MMVLRTYSCVTSPDGRGPRPQMQNSPDVRGIAISRRVDGNLGSCDTYREEELSGGIPAPAVVWEVQHQVLAGFHL